VHACLSDTAEHRFRLGRRLERRVELVRVPGGESRSAAAPGAADDDRGPRPLRGLGQRWRVGDLVILAVKGERGPGRGRPQAGDDRELLLEPVEPLGQRRERHAVGRVLGVEPARAQAELDPAAAHLVDLRDGDGQRPRQPEGGAGH
jgi:hypothetical protein